MMLETFREVARAGVLLWQPPVIAVFAIACGFFLVFVLVRQYQVGRGQAGSIFPHPPDGLAVLGSAVFLIAAVEATGFAFALPPLEILAAAWGDASAYVFGELTQETVGKGTPTSLAMVAVLIVLVVFDARAGLGRLSRTEVESKIWPANESFFTQVLFVLTFAIILAAIRVGLFPDWISLTGLGLLACFLLHAIAPRMTAGIVAVGLPVLALDLLTALATGAIALPDASY